MNWFVADQQPRHRREPTAADFQIGLTVGDLRPLIEGRPLEPGARRWFPEYPGEIPAGAFPATWVPSSS